MAEPKNELSAWALLITPAVVVAILHSIIPAAGHYIDLNWELGLMYGTALLLGILLFRRSRKVLDHEFFRAKSIKRLRKAYTAEDRGLWTKADSAMAQLERDAEGFIATDDEAGRDRGKQTDEMQRRSMSGEEEEKEELEVRLLSEEDHVRRSTSRMSGDELEDPMAAIAASDLEHARRQAARPANVDSDLMRALTDEDSARAQKEKQKKAAAPAPAPKPKPKPKPEPKPAPAPAASGTLEPAGVEVEPDQGIAGFAASAGGGGSGKETKFCLDCGARNSISRTSCSNCGSVLT